MIISLSPEPFTIVVFSLLIVTFIVARFFDKYRENRLVNNVFDWLRPVATGLIAAAGASIMLLALFGTEFSLKTLSVDIEKLAMLIVFILILSMPKTKKIHPVLLIAMAAAGGMIFKM